ncbi:MAG: hypothetical protein JKY62_14530 [Desulfocapsa sp.]|nr:hypothetical protein [Desulfocapsa sp.]MBN4060041.1 hypothetical protein [Desulfotalea psychrophila]
MPETDIKLGYFDQPKTKKMLWRLLWAICILSLLLEFFIQRKVHFPQEDFFGFYGLLGFIACSCSILLAKLVGFFLKKGEDYYDADK